MEPLENICETEMKAAIISVQHRQQGGIGMENKREGQYLPSTRIWVIHMTDPMNLPIFTWTREEVWDTVTDPSVRYVVIRNTWTRGICLIFWTRQFCTLYLMYFFNIFFPKDIWSLYLFDCQKINKLLIN